ETGDLRASIVRIDGVPAVLPIDAEAGALDQPLEDPVIGAVLVANVSSELGSCKSLALRLGHARDPGIDLPAMLDHGEGEYDVAEEQSPTCPQHFIHAEEGDALPEVRQVVEGIFGDEHVGWRTVMRITEKSAAPELHIVQGLAGRAPAREREHAGRDVYRVHGPAASGRLDGECTGTTADVDDDVIAVDAELVEEGAILLGVHVLISIVGVDRRRVLEVDADLAEVVIVPVRHGAPRSQPDRL